MTLGRIAVPEYNSTFASELVEMAFGHFEKTAGLATRTYTAQEMGRIYAHRVVPDIATTKLDPELIKEALMSPGAAPRAAGAVRRGLGFLKRMVRGGRGAAGTVAQEGAEAAVAGVAKGAPVQTPIPRTLVTGSGKTGVIPPGGGPAGPRGTVEVSRRTADIPMTTGERWARAPQPPPGRVLEEAGERATVGYGAGGSVPMGRGHGALSDPVASKKLMGAGGKTRLTLAETPVSKGTFVPEGATGRVAKAVDPNAITLPPSTPRHMQGAIPAPGHPQFGMGQSWGTGTTAAREGAERALREAGVGGTAAGRLSQISHTGAVPRLATPAMAPGSAAAAVQDVARGPVPRGLEGIRHTGPAPAGTPPMAPGSAESARRAIESGGAVGRVTGARPLPTDIPGVAPATGAGRIAPPARAPAGQTAPVPMHDVRQAPVIRQLPTTPAPSPTPTAPGGPGVGPMAAAGRVALPGAAGAVAPGFGPASAEFAEHAARLGMKPAQLQNITRLRQGMGDQLAARAMGQKVSPGATKQLRNMAAEYHQEMAAVARAQGNPGQAKALERLAKQTREATGSMTPREASRLAKSLEDLSPTAAPGQVGRVAEAVGQVAPDRTMGQRAWGAVKWPVYGTLGLGALGLGTVGYLGHEMARMNQGTAWRYGSRGLPVNYTPQQM